MKFIRNLSIKHKLVAIILLVSIPALGIGFTTMMIEDIARMKKDMEYNTRMQASLVGEYCASPLEFDLHGTASETLAKLLLIPVVENAIVYDELKEEFATYTKPEGKQIISPEPTNSDSILYENEFLHVFHPIENKNKRFGYLYLRVSTLPLETSINKKILFLSIVFVGLIVFSYIMALWLQRMISHPILKLAKVTENISNQSDFSIRVQRDAKDEIGTLYDRFNNMLEQIQIGQKRRDEAEAEQKRLLEELEEKNKELEQVIYVTSHDLRSPLVNIQGFSQELNLSLKELESITLINNEISTDTREKIHEIFDKDIQESLKYIEASTNKMDGLLSGLLKLSRVDRMTATFDFIDMNRLISDILNSLEFLIKEVGGQVHVENLPSCYGNELQLNQLFSNLITNSIKYRSPSRPIEISITGKELRNEKRLLYSVKDNGIGIPKEYHKKIFEIFHRLNPDETEGEGLGLAIVSKIVTRHKGSIRVDSKPGEGTYFFISFPLVAPNIPVNPAPASNPPAQ